MKSEFEKTMDVMRAAREAMQEDFQTIKKNNRVSRRWLIGCNIVTLVSMVTLILLKIFK